ncbi:acyltransferase [Streptomyces sp. NPDC026589]|uniref:acyltransferase family protein n=1 Tax=Streptomyces sp. NPDC026589 TaxID=3155609 RepID=UPI0033D00588
MAPPPDAPPTPNSRLPSLTGMRFMAALMVFFCHVYTEAYPAGGSQELFRLAVGLGWLGVGFFFVLSGFVLTWSAREDDTPPRFWRRRVLKIFPNHLVTWAVSLVIVLAITGTVSWKQTVPSLFLVQGAIPDLDFLAINVPSWSLGCELVFYLCFPWVLRQIRRIREELLGRWIAGFTLAIVAVPVFADLVLPDRPAAPGMNMSTWQNWFVYPFPPVRMLDFVLGMLVARYVLAGRRLPLGLTGATLLFLGGIGLQFLLTPSVYGMAAPTALPVVLLIAAAARTDALGIPSLWRGRTVVWLGEVSFAFYMVHFLVIRYGRQVPGAEALASAAGEVSLALVFLVVSLLLAWLLHSTVEDPAMRRWSRPRAKPRSDGRPLPEPHLG